MYVSKYISAKMGFFLSCTQWTNYFSTKIHVETKTAFSNKRILKIWCEIDLSSKYVCMHQSDIHTYDTW